MQLCLTSICNTCCCRPQAGGGVCLAGAMEREVKTRQEMVEVLEQGTLLRATGAAACHARSAAAMGHGADLAVAAVCSRCCL